MNGGIFGLLLGSSFLETSHSDVSTGLWNAITVEIANIFSRSGILSDVHPDIIQCSCGQKMRIPAGSQSQVFKCVRCGALVDRHPTKSRHADGDPSTQAHQGENDPLLNLFLNQGLINEEQAAEALAEFVPDKEKIFETLIRLQIITEDQLHAFLAKESGTAMISLAHFTIDRHLTDLIPIELITSQWVLPIDKLGRSMTVAMVCPLDTAAIRAVEEYSGLRLRPMLCKASEFQISLNKHFRHKSKEPGGLTAQPITRTMIPPKKQSETPTQEKATTAAKVVDFREAIQALDTLPVPTKIMNLVDASVGTDAVGLRQIIAAAQKTPPFTARLLSNANSQAYGIPGQVNSIPMAVALLGDEAISIVTMALPKYTTADESLWNPWNHFSQYVAKVAALFAGGSGRVVPNEAYCAGLLHGIGVYALAAVAEEETKHIDPALIGPARLAVEEQLFKLCHNEAGAILCRRWNIPESIATAVGWYPDPGKAGSFRDLAELLFIATQLATVDGSLNRDALTLCKESFDYLQLGSKDVSTLIEQYTSQRAKA